MYIIISLFRGSEIFKTCVCVWPLNVIPPSSSGHNTLFTIQELASQHCIVAQTASKLPLFTLLRMKATTIAMGEAWGHNSTTMSCFHLYTRPQMSLDTRGMSYYCHSIRYEFAIWHLIIGGVYTVQTMLTTEERGLLKCLYHLITVIK